MFSNSKSYRGGGGGGGGLTLLYSQHATKIGSHNGLGEVDCSRIRHTLYDQSIFLFSQHLALFLPPMGGSCVENINLLNDGK